MLLQRKVIISEIIAQSEPGLAQLKASKAGSDVASKEAASPMEATYDTRKYDMAKFADAQRIN